MDYSVTNFKHSYTRWTQSFGVAKCALLLLIIFTLILYSGVFLTNSTLIPPSQPALVNQADEYLNQDRTQEYTRDPGGTIGSDVAALAYLRSSWLNGSIPLWNPFQGLGQPFSADAPAAVFYPLNAMYLILNPKYSDVFQLFQIALGGWGLLLFARLSRYKIDSSLIASCAYLTSGFFVIFAPTISIISTIIWLPFAIFSVEKIFHEPMNNLSSILLAGSILGLGTGGHISFSILGALALCVYIITRTLLQKKNHSQILLRITVGVVIGALISAPHWLLTTDYVLEARELIADVKTGAYQLQALPAIFLPNVYGWLNDTNILGLQNSLVGDYWGLGWFVPPVSFLFVLGLFRVTQKHDSSIVAITVVSLFFVAWAFGVPPISYISDIPFLGRLKVGYIMAIPVIGYAILAGYGFEGIETYKTKFFYLVIKIWFILIIFLIYIVMHTADLPFSVMLKNAKTVEILKFGLLPGIIWSIIFPLALVLNRVTKRGASLFSITIAGIFLSVISYFPFYEPKHSALLRLLACAFFVIWIVADFILSYLFNEKNTIYIL